MRQYPWKTSPRLGHQARKILKASKPGHQANKGKNTWIYHLPGDKVDTETSPWLEAIDARDREMSFVQLLHEPNIYLLSDISYQRFNMKQQSRLFIRGLLVNDGSKFALGKTLSKFEQL